MLGLAAPRLLCLTQTRSTLKGTATAHRTRYMRDPCSLKEREANARECETNARECETNARECETNAKKCEETRRNAKKHEEREKRDENAKCGKVALR